MRANGGDLGGGSETLIVVQQDNVFGQSGFGTYAAGVKTLNASMVKRPEDTIVISD